MTGPGLPPRFRLNLSTVSKGPQTSSPAQPQADDARPSDPLPKADLKKGATASFPVRGNTTLARKNLVIGSDSSSDEDLGLELIPVGQDDPTEKANAIPDVIEAPAIAISALPDLNVAYDDEEEREGNSEAGNFSILQEMLLNIELAEEPEEPWSYHSFIRLFAKTEASHEGAEGGEEEENEYSFGNEEDDDYD
jgi:hypothetical protein